MVIFAFNNPLLMKHIFAQIALCLLLVALVGCGQSPNQSEVVVDSNRGDASDSPSEYWNSWFQVSKVGGWERLDGLAATPGIDYQLVVDISSLEYSLLEDGIDSVLASSNINHLISDHIDNQQKTIRFTIRAIITDPILRLAQGESIQKVLEVDLEKIQNRNYDTAILEAMQESHEDFLRGASIIRAGQFTYNLSALSSGCTSIAFSIWDSAGVIPLDYLVQPIVIADREGNIPDCNFDSSLRSGLNNLAMAGIINESGTNIPIDAALQIFEWREGSRIRSVAVFVNPTSDSNADDSTQQDVYYWNLRAPISSYIYDGALLRSIRSARKRSNTKEFEDRAYANVADELRRRIFSARYVNGQRNPAAQNAYSALQEMTEDSTESINLLARLISVDNEILILPLDILNAEQGEHALDGLRVLHPLPERHRLTSADSCIDTWSFAIPEKLDGLDVDQILQQDLESLDIQRKPPWLTNWVRQISDLFDYFGQSSVVQAEDRGEGLVLVSHHDGGSLWFDRLLDQPVGISDMYRSYPNGSVAMLAACSANVAGSSISLLADLNRSGIDAFVMSPFPVRADYGARLALEFSEAVINARNSLETPTLGELFDTATLMTGNYFQMRNRPGLKDMQYEFVILGDSQLQLCSN